MPWNETCEAKQKQTIEGSIQYLDHFLMSDCELLIVQQRHHYSMLTATKHQHYMGALGTHLCVWITAPDPRMEKALKNKGVHWLSNSYWSDNNLSGEGIPLSVESLGEASLFRCISTTNKSLEAGISNTQACPCGTLVLSFPSGHHLGQCKSQSCFDR
jgi:hypothetical protein